MLDTRDVCDLNNLLFNSVLMHLQEVFVIEGTGADGILSHQCTV